MLTVEENQSMTDPLPPIPAGTVIYADCTGPAPTEDDKEDARRHCREYSLGKDDVKIQLTAEGVLTVRTLRPVRLRRKETDDE